MPELPEVETVVRGLVPVLTGTRIQSLVVRRPDLRWPVPEDLETRLRGARVLAVRRRAKFGLLDTDRGDTLIFHLGMSGRFRLDPAEVLAHDHVLLQAGGRRLAFHDPRRFGSIHLVQSRAAHLHPLLAQLGPEPLSEAFDGDTLARAAAGRQAPIRALLLDQRVVAGLGNIYVAEALFRARVNPMRRAGGIARGRLDRIAESVKQVLAEAIAAGGSSLRDHVGVGGTLGTFQHHFQVYGRSGAPCPACGAPIRRETVAGRSSFACKRCQR
ncbi:MAG: bifunctional DNA-formamidopyrimidine glycosylase/DNA-(apurinic or apyrimidinic site) lyase [Sphingomonadaceae bacterium]